MARIDEIQFLGVLTKGVNRTKDFIAKLTDYRGGSVKTEYILTTDIAREFVDLDYEVKVECLNRTLVNGFTKKKSVVPRKLLGAKRTDVAIVSDVIPRALIEVKIGVKNLGRLKADLKKIADTILMMKEGVSSNVLGAVVFEIHVPNAQNRLHEKDFLNAAVKIERSISKELAIFGKRYKELCFTMYHLQDHFSGVVGREIEENFGEKSWGIGGHATRYHAILLSRALYQEV